MVDTLASIESLLKAQPGLPPVHLWNPALCGDIDIVIRRNGEWWHEGRPIKREQLVKLFASILRREPDGEYYLVTPVEKLRVQVEDTPLLIVDFDVQQAGTGQQQIIVTSNVGRQYLLGERYPLQLGSDDQHSDSSDLASIPVVQLDNDLLARFDRPAYYRLIDRGVLKDNRLELLSEGQTFVIGYL